MERERETEIERTERDRETELERPRKAKQKKKKINETPRLKKKQQNVYLLIQNPIQTLEINYKKYREKKKGGKQD